MGGYIGAKTGTLVASASDIRGDISATDTTPEITLKNTTETDADGGREGTVTFKGEKSGGEEVTLAQIEGSHDDTNDDSRGQLVFKTNNNQLGDNVTEAKMTIDSVGDVDVTSGAPSITITNTTHEDTDGGRESKLKFKGEQSGGELSTLAQIEASHDGTADDQKGDLIFKTNDGSDGASPTERLRIDSDGSILTATLGTDNVHLGEGAGASIASGAINNVAIGKNALTSMTTSDFNTAVGMIAATAVTTGQRNTALGYGALQTDTQGSRNVALGFNSLGTQNFTSATDSYNIGIGYDAGGAVTTGTHNTFVGALAGDATDDGIQNVAVGKSALTSNCGDNNTAVGLEALRDTTGSVNTAIGKNSGNAITSGSKNTIIGSYTGNGGGLDIRTSSNNIVLSDGDGNPRINVNSNGDSYIKQNLRVGTVAAGNGVVDLNGRTGTYVVDYIDSAGTRRMVVVAGSGDLQNVNNSYGAISDVKLKENITDAASQWDDIKALTVRKYSMKADNLEAPNQLGVIAQELEAAGMNGLVSEAPDMDADNNDLGTTTKAVKYSILYMKAVKALQEAMTRIETLEAQNTTQATQIADLITRVTALEAG